MRRLALNRGWISRLAALTLVIACGDSDERGGSTSMGVSSTGIATTGGEESGGAGTEGAETTDGGSSSGAEETGEATEDTGGTGVKWDVGSDTEGVVECGCGFADWSQAWIANTEQGTVSKIDTRSLIEEARYITRPDGAGNPSRTSVSIDGKAAVVANRYVGVAKIWTQEAFCDPNHNGVPGLQTSSGKNDVLPWGEDDCVEWFRDFPGMTTNRPVAWSTGQLNEETCEYEDQQVWTMTGSGANLPGDCSGGGVWVYRLNGETGNIDDQLHIDQTEVACTWRGPYGGAVDPDGDFWFHTRDANPPLVRVNAEDLTYEIWPTPLTGYGMTVDQAGRVWINERYTPKIARFDPVTETWDMADAGGKGGIAQDLQGRIWTADSEFGIRAIDADSMQLGPLVVPPGVGHIKGVSVDIDGYIWAIRLYDPTAYRYDPDDLTWESYTGLDEAYTYSDFTGGQLNQVFCDPQG